MSNDAAKMSDDVAEKPLAFEAYETLAESYAALVGEKPHNAYYERPATLSLLLSSVARLWLAGEEAKHLDGD